MFAVRELLLFAIVASLLASAILAVWPGARRHGRFALEGLAASVGFIGWNLTLNARDATGFNVDAPIILLSRADSGGAVLAFAVSALVLGLIAERDEPAGRVVGAAAIDGLAAIIVDLVVL